MSEFKDGSSSYTDDHLVSSFAFAHCFDRHFLLLLEKRASPLIALDLVTGTAGHTTVFIKVAGGLTNH